MHLKTLNYRMTHLMNPKYTELWKLKVLLQFRLKFDNQFLLGIQLNSNLLDHHAATSSTSLIIFCHSRCFIKCRDLINSRSYERLLHHYKRSWPKNMIFCVDFKKKIFGYAISRFSQINFAREVPYIQAEREC